MIYATREGMTDETSHLSEFDQVLECISQSALNEDLIAQHVRGLFSRSLTHFGSSIYLANHSLGRVLDQTESDVVEGLSYWYRDAENAWEYWIAEINDFRQGIASLIQAPGYDCIIPKTSAGQGLRAILNCYDKPIRVVSSADEFNSIDHILKIYAQKGRIELERASPALNREYTIEDFSAALDKGADLLVVSMVMFTTGQLLEYLPSLIESAHCQGTKVVVDLYHATGVVPLNVTAMQTDFAIGGCYKYLHGGPGACWLYLNPEHLDGSLQTLDTGWFSQSEPFSFNRPEMPDTAAGGNGFLESTPAILPVYQARAGLAFTLATGVERIRHYSLHQQQYLEQRLRDNLIPFLGKCGTRGAFVAMPHQCAGELAMQLETEGIICDAREGLLRFGPDLLNSKAELSTAVEKLAFIWAD